MHDLPAMYARILDIVASSAEACFRPDGNTRAYPKPPKLTDLEVIALASTAESLEVDSENLLWAKLRDYPDFLPHRCGRQAFNRRRRRLRRQIDLVNATIADWLDPETESLVVDSMPLETVRITRADQSHACRRPKFDAQCADKTYHASTKRWICGYKIHAIFTASGIYVEHVVRPASHHDLTVFRELTDLAEDDALESGLVNRLRDRLILADKAYGSAEVQLQFFQTFGADLQAIPKENATDWKPWPSGWTLTRRYVETVFSQLCDEVRAKLNRAKRFAGLNTRISTKLLVRTIKQFVNHHSGRPINQTKYCWLPLEQ